MREDGVSVVFEKMGCGSWKHDPLQVGYKKGSRWGAFENCYDQNFKICDLFSLSLKTSS